MSKLDEFLAGAVADCVDGVPAILEEDLVDGGAASEPPVFTGDQGGHDVRAVQLRPENFSQPMIDKAGRLAAAGAWDDLNDGRFAVLGDSGAWYQLRVFGERTWFATCTCAARASRWNHAGACAHRALAGWLRAQAIGQPIPRWPALTMPVLTTEEPG